jgi:hypothetical protein
MNIIEMAEVACAVDDMCEWLEHHKVKALPGWTSRTRMLKQLRKAKAILDSCEWPGDHERLKTARQKALEPK